MKERSDEAHPFMTAQASGARERMVGRQMRRRGLEPR